jgi:hypothetical protein
MRLLAHMASLGLISSNRDNCTDVDSIEESVFSNAVKENEKINPGMLIKKFLSNIKDLINNNKSPNPGDRIALVKKFLLEPLIFETHSPMKWIEILKESCVIGYSKGITDIEKDKTREKYKAVDNELISWIKILKIKDTCFEMFKFLAQMDEEHIIFPLEVIQLFISAAIEIALSENELLHKVSECKKITYNQ